jgi:DNA adenine methylase
MASSSPRYLSPLRYPGGKERLAAFVTHLIRAQRRPASTYIEPFAGGAGVGLRLLFNEVVDDVVLNDLEPGLSAFWRSVFEQTTRLSKLIERCRPTIEEWHRQHAVYVARPEGDLELGFATFFLNRTNRSGILDARPIGGYRQSSAWGIDARFNASELAERVRRLGRYRDRVIIEERDGIDLLGAALNDRGVFAYVDPPYLDKGDHLYLNTLEWDDHLRLADTLCARGSWLVTYDTDPRVPRVLYPNCRCARYEISHTAAKRHVGREYAIFSPDLKIGSLDLLGEAAAFEG